MGHIVVKTLHEVEIEVAPQELPHNLPVDLSTLVNVGDHIVTKEIKLPPSAKLIANADEVVALVKEFKEEAAEIAPPPETVIIGEEKAKAEEGAEAEKKQEGKSAKGGSLPAGRQAPGGKVESK